MEITSYFSFLYVVAFLPLVIVLYSIVPKKGRWAVLLIASYVFFWLFSTKLIVFILASTVVTYLLGRKLESVLAQRSVAVKAVERPERKAVKARYLHKMRRWLALGVVANFAMLIGLKYLVFFGEVGASLLALFGVSVDAAVPYIGVPIGISFYTLMAASYLFDVYHEKTQADHNLARIALFLSFFPQIMEGPICRYDQTAYALFEGNPVKADNLYKGVLRIVWGFTKKLVIADRLNLVVQPVFADYANYDGGVVALVAVLYTIQLYCDFSGCIDMCIGTGRILGVKIPENFRHPFFSRTASEFWQRWHITLGTWLRDYIFYPVSLSKPLKTMNKAARSRIGNRFGPLLVGSITLFCVWFTNGLWHGAGSQYLFFGMYYFVLITLGGFVDVLMVQFSEKTGLNRQSKGYHAFQIARTLVAIFVGELFFRAEGMDAGLAMFGTMVGNFTLESFFNGTVLGIGMDVADFAIAALFLVVMLVVAIVEERGTVVSDWLWDKGVLARWVPMLALLFFVIIFGSYGSGALPLDPIYAQF